MSTNGSLLEMVLESHIKIKCISAVPEADTDESAATCGHTHTHTRYIFCRVKLEHTLHGYIHTLTVVILYPQHKVSAGIADRFHGNAGILLHRSLCKQLPCRTGGHTAATNATRSIIQLTFVFRMEAGEPWMLQLILPETLSSSLINATLPLAVILIRPDQSGASSFQSAALG